MKAERRFQIKIERYILGKLTQDEIDDLWIEFLKAPAWFKWFELELHIRSIVKKRSKSSYQL